MTAIKKKSTLLIPYVYLLPFFWEVQRALQMLSHPSHMLSSLEKRTRNCLKSGSILNTRWDLDSFILHTLLWFVLCIQCTILEHRLDAVNRGWVKKNTLLQPFLCCCSSKAKAQTCKQLSPDLQTQLPAGWFVHQAIPKVTSAWCARPLTSNMIPGPQLYWNGFKIHWIAPACFWD